LPPTFTTGKRPTFSLTPSNFFFASSFVRVSAIEAVATSLSSFLSFASAKPSFSCVKTRA